MEQETPDPAALVGAARGALNRLADLGETIGDEWQYVNDLRRVWGNRLDTLAAELAARPQRWSADPQLLSALAGALQTVVAECQLVTDPNRAIDWLSTLPQIVFAAAGRPVELPTPAASRSHRDAAPLPGPGGASSSPAARQPERPGGTTGPAGPPTGPLTGPPTGMRFADPVPDHRHVVYAAIQADPLVLRAADLLAEATTEERLLARAAMNGERADPAVWRAIFPGLFGPAAAGTPEEWRRREEILEVSLAVALKGEQARSQYRGAMVEALTERLLARRTRAVRRERRVLFDGRPAEIHPYDVTVEEPGRPEVYDCKWGARGINADVLHQLDDARRHAAEVGMPLIVGLVVFDARLSCLVRLARQTAPRRGTRLATIETLDDLAAGPPRQSAAPP